MNSRIIRLVLRLTAAVAFVASIAGCSNWVLAVVQSFGAPGDAKISTIAGNGTGGYAGDGGPATSAALHQPTSVAEDSSGNLYIVDSLNSLIRMVNTSGVITTVPAVPADLFNPIGVAVDPMTNEIYISDTGNGAIKRIHSGAMTPVASTSVGTVPANLSDPYGIAFDSSGNLYVADMGNSRVLEFVNAIGSGTTIAGINGSPGYSGDGGLATLAHLNSPSAVAVDALGNIYIADSLNFLIRRIDHSTGNISTVVGNNINGYSGDDGPATAAEIQQPFGIALDASGNLYISEINSVVRKVDTNGIISTVAGNVHLGAGYGGDGNVATAAMLDEPWELAIDSSGNLLIADFVNNRIRKVAFGK